MYSAVVLGSNRTHGNAHSISTARGSTIVRLRVTCLRRAFHLESERGGRLRDLLVEVGHWNCRQWVARAARRAEVLSAVTRDAEFCLGLNVPGLKVLIGQRPILPHAI